MSILMFVNYLTKTIQVLVKNQLSGTVRMMRENLYYLESLFTS
jgi:hypothetical protein